MTATERLAEIDAAIASVTTGGQSYKIKDRQLQRADLATLYAMRKETAAEAAEENSDGLGRRTAAVYFDRR